MYIPNWVVSYLIFTGRYKSDKNMFETTRPIIDSSPYHECSGLPPQWLISKYLPKSGNTNHKSAKKRSQNVFQSLNESHWFAFEKGIIKITTQKKPSTMAIHFFPRCFVGRPRPSWSKRYHQIPAVPTSPAIFGGFSSRNQVALVVESA